MSDDFWSAVLSRITPHAPIDLDQDIFAAAAGAQGSGAAAEGMANGQPMPELSADLWHRGDELRSFIGVRVTRSLADCAPVAVKLAAAALERGVVPIILSTLPNSGFERFGFRVERIPEGQGAATEQFEKELSRFWNLAMIIDCADVVRIG